IERNNGTLLTKFGAGLGQRVILYKGIDTNHFFPQLLEEFNETGSAKGISPANRSVAPRTQPFHQAENTVIYGDHPPTPLFWVGRINETELLRSTAFKSVFVTGIGGQGKSCLLS